MKFKKLLAVFLIITSVTMPSVLAANYDIKQMTPEIKRAIEGRQSRYTELQVAKQAGTVRENSQGLVSGNSGLVNAENKDRMVIYRAIVEQNNLGAAGLDLVQKTFAETIREREGY